MKRSHISLKDKLAAALLQHVRWDEHECQFVPVIPYLVSKTMTADQIIARFELHHNIRHAEGGTDDPWNLTWMPTAEHRERTAKIDIPQIAKGKRIRRREAGIRKPRTIRQWRKFDGSPVYASRER